MEDKRDRKEDEEHEDKHHKKDSNDEKSSKKSIDDQGLPSGWSRLSIPRKNGKVDYYIVNQKVCYTLQMGAQYTFGPKQCLKIFCV